MSLPEQPEATEPISDEARKRPDHGEVDFSEKILGLVMDELNNIGRKK